MYDKAQFKDSTHKHKNNYSFPFWCYAREKILWFLYVKKCSSLKRKKKFKIKKHENMVGYKNEEPIMFIIEY